MTDATRNNERSRRSVVQTLGTGLATVALVATAGLTTAGGNEGRREGNESRSSREEPLYVHGPTTRYQQIDQHPPGVFGELENRSERTVRMARLDVEFYAEDGQHLGSRTQYFFRIRSSESREISLPFDIEYFDDRSVRLASGALDTVLGSGRIVSERTNPEHEQ